jgi:hypothetical protein
MRSAIAVRLSCTISIDQRGPGYAREAQREQQASRGALGGENSALGGTTQENGSST